MLSINYPSFTARTSQRSQSQPQASVNSVNNVTTSQPVAADTVRFSAGGSQAEADKAYLEKFFQENPNHSDASNVLAPQTRSEKAVGIAIQKYMDALKQGRSFSSLKVTAKPWLMQAI